MERTSFIYRTRRKAQVFAHRIIPNDSMSKLYYLIVLKKKLNLDNPQTFNEKLQWLKLYYFPQNSLVVQCTDKYAVRDFIKKMGYGDKLVPLYGCWKKAKDINWDDLPNQFVLKCNHGCAYNIVCTNKNTLDKNATIKQLDEWQKEDF